MTISTLVVDDNANTRADIGSSLSSLDINLVFANDGLDGLKQAKEGCFDLLIIDHKMLKHGATRCLSKPLQAQFLCDVVSYYTKRSVA